MLDIATAKSRNEIRWQNQRISWQDLVTKCASPEKTHETLAMFMAGDTEYKQGIKDVGGFVTGFLLNGSRSKSAVLHKQIVSLDADYTQPGFIERVQTLPVACVWHTTHSHAPGAPRYRLLVPLDRPVVPFEYEPIARYIAAYIGIDNVDRTSYDLNRLMFWPSVSKDGEFLWGENQGPFASADGILATYTNWQDASSWPIGASESVQIRSDVAALGDPKLKPGIVGAFCRVYDPHTVIAKFLSNVYDPTDNPDRYTYRYGSSAKGLIVYDDHTWSHHGTDPTSGTACNAFDLIRMHLFGGALDNPEQKMGERKSFKECSEYVRSLPEVRQLLMQERYQSAQQDFGTGVQLPVQFTGIVGAPVPQADFDSGLSPYATGAVGLVGFPGVGELAMGMPLGAPVVSAAPVVDSVGAVLPLKPVEVAGDGVAPLKQEKTYNDTNWLSGVEIDKQGKPVSSLNNIVHIIRYDPALKGCFAFDDFAKKGVMLRQPPWWRAGRSPIHSDTDDAYLQEYLESTYGISAPTKMFTALTVVSDRSSFHPVRNYLNSLTWDGVSRIEYLFNAFLGAEDSEYTRQVSRKWFTAAVTRVFRPGCKFDNMIIFVGKEGKGKSTLIDKLGSPWFSDTSVDLRNKKESMEELQGVWIMEWAELTSFRTASVEQVKSFVSKKMDRFRAPYGRRVDDYPRQCIFMGSTNLMEFLNDPDGNRRFWPVLIEAVPIRHDVYNEFTDEIKHQVWAEAMHLFKSGEPLVLSKELVEEAKMVQKRHTESDDRLALIDAFLEETLPARWYLMDEGERLVWRTNRIPGDIPGGFKRTKVCAAEIWIEVFGGTKLNMDRRNTRFIHNHLRGLSGWDATPSWVSFGCIGNQRGYYRKDL